MRNRESQERLRRFERLSELYLRRVHASLASEDFSETEMRVIQALDMMDGGGSGAHVANCLALDQGYVCRILKKLAAYELIEGKSSPTDQRARNWELTKFGRGFAASIERKCRDRARIRVDFLLPVERRRLLVAMSIVENLLLEREVNRF